MSQIIIDTAQSKDHPEAARVTARAMINNPLAVAVFNGAQEIFEIINRVSFESGWGRVYLAKEKDQILGVMRITEWPDCHAKFKEGYKLPPPAVALLKDSAPRMEQWLQTWGKRDPEKHHWHLTLLAVLPERQRQGIGKKLVNLYCDFLDSTGSAGYIETDRDVNVPFYESFGFKVMDKEPILNVPNWYLWREKNRWAVG
jgi:ribosomal protein S18 acetylase RimI-like enzyme